MPPTTSTSNPKKAPFEVLITGFGPFGPFESNPSWESVGPLHNTELSLSHPPSSSPSHPNPVDESLSASPLLHIQTLQSSVSYSNVLSLVPLLHNPNVPPTSPSASPWLDPRGDVSGAQGDGSSYPTSYRVNHPSRGYDLIVHVGVGSKGGVRIESQAHKDRYASKDVRGMYAPTRGTLSGGEEEMSLAQREEQLRLASTSILDDRKGKEESKEGIDRGFAEGYEQFEMVEKTQVDVEALVKWLKAERGVENVAVSNDPGRFLCDFIYYCSLAESKRASIASSSSSSVVSSTVPKKRAIPTLFIHVPPNAQPYTPHQTRKIITDVVWWIANKWFGDAGGERE